MKVKVKKDKQINQYVAVCKDRAAQGDTKEKALKELIRLLMIETDYMRSDSYASAKDIFSGRYSKDVWETINSAKTKSDLRDALYLVCCRIQELESKI